MRDITKLERAWLNDLKGDLFTAWKENLRDEAALAQAWNRLLAQYEEKSGVKFEVRSYGSSTFNGAFHGMEYGYFLAVVGTYPRDGKTITTTIESGDYQWPHKEV